MASKTPDNNLGSFLTNKKIANIDIHADTSISAVELSKLRNGIIKKIPAKKLALIALSINVDIGKVVMETYPNLKLEPSKDNAKVSKSTKLGKFLDGVENNTLTIISHRTGISVPRLKILKTRANAIPLAHELYLIELATNEKPGNLFKLIFSDLVINTPEVQKILREKEKLRSAKKKK